MMHQLIVIKIRKGKTCIRCTSTYCHCLSSHNERSKTLLTFCNKNGINVIPRSGKTATEGGLENWKESTIVIDGSQMNQIINIDTYNMQATVQSGVKLQTLEDELCKSGYTTGHSPQSKPVAQMGD